MCTGKVQKNGRKMEFNKVTPRFASQEFKPNKPREYRMFLLWRSLPLAMRKGGSQYLEELGIEDEDMHELVNIRTQGQFAHAFGVDQSTISQWKNEPVPLEYQDMDWRVWAKKLASEVLQKLWEGIEEHKDPASIKLYMQLIGEYTETSKVQVDYTTDLFEGMRALVENMNQGTPAAIPATAKQVEPGKRPLKPREKTVAQLLKETRKTDPR